MESMDGYEDEWLRFVTVVFTGDADAVVELKKEVTVEEVEP